MFEFFLILQYVGVFSIIVFLSYIATLRSTPEKGMISVMCIAVLVTMLGYSVELTAVNAEEAIAGIRIAYLGKCFLCWLIMRFVFIFYNIKNMKWFLRITAYIQTVFYLIIFTCNNHDLFIKSYESIIIEDHFHVIYTYGPIYYINLVFVVSYISLCLGLSYYIYTKNKNTTKGKIALKSTYVGIVPLMGYVLKFNKILQPYDVTNLTLVIAVIGLTYVILKYKVFEIVDLAKTNVIENLNEAVVVLDKDFMTIYYNNAAKELFPDVDKKQFHIIKDYLNVVNKFYEERGRYYEVEIKELFSKTKVNGYVVILKDMTDHVKYSENLENMVSEKTKQIETIQQKVLVSFANMIELRDDITGHHVKRTSEYVRIILNAMKNSDKYKDIVNDKYIERVCNAAPLHDIGKIAISDSILCKPDKLTKEEFEIIKTHPKIGGEMLNEVLDEIDDDDYLYYARDMAAAHHEKWDGSGYPYGLRGEQIPLCARIMAIADVYDALTSKRTYKEAYSADKAFGIIEDSAGTHFDPDIVKIFLQCKDDILKI